MSEKSTVKVLLKSGVSKDSKMGFEIEATCVEGTTKETMQLLGDMAMKEAERLANIKINIQG